MKRLYSFVALMLLSVSMMAQGWQTITTEVDELLGTDGSNIVVYDDNEMGMFAYYGDNQFALICKGNYFFNNERDGRLRGQSVLVGLYDDGILIDKFNLWLDEVENQSMKILMTRNANAMSTPIAQKKKVQKIIKQLNTERGYVRFVASRYNASNFDLRVYAHPDGLE